MDSTFTDGNFDRGIHAASTENSEDKYRLIFENSPLGAIHFDQNGIITACNDSFVSIIGSSREKILGLNMTQLPDKKIVAAVKEALKGRNGFYYGNYKSTTAIKTTPVRVNFAPFVTGEGKKCGGVGIIEDITLHESAERAVQEQQAYFEKLFEASPEGIVILNNNDEVIRANDTFCQMFGFETSELIGKPVNSLIVPDELKDEGLRLTLAAAAGQVVRHETVRKTKSNALINVSILASPITTKEGNVAVYGIYRDITRQKNTEKALILAKEKAEESDRLKTSFLNNLSHEVRTPMNAIMGFSQLLNEKEVEKDQFTHLTDTILQSSVQLMSVIDSIVRISTIEAGLLEIMEQATNIKELARTVYEQFKPRADAQGIKFRFNCMLGDAQAYAVTDEGKLQTILIALLDNAIKFTPKGHIELGCMLQNDTLKFYVADTGAGVDPEYRNIIFERFRQGETNNTRLNSGLGLGLPIARAYVEALGGNIWLDPDPGTGSVFYFTLPYRKSAVAEHAQESTMPVQEKLKKTVLVAEDEEHNFYLVREILSSRNLNILHAWNGKEAVEMVKQYPDIDLILMDIKMPLMNGYEATNIIKSMSPEIPVVALTAYAMVGDREKTLEHGCDDYLAKPVTLKDFHSLVEKYLD